MSNFKTTMKQLTKDNLQPVYVLLGTEYYFIEQFKQKIMKVMDNSIEDTMTYDLREVAIEDVLVDAETFPFFNESKLIFIEEPIFLKAKAEKVAVEHDLTTLDSYVQNPVPYTVLVVVAPYEKLDERKKITKQLKKNAVVVDCQPLKERDLRFWVQELAKAEGITLEPEASMLLENAFQTNLYVLQKEIEKLALYVGKSGVVTKSIAENMMSQTVNQNALQLVDAVLGRDLHKAITIYRDLIKMSDDAIGLIALLAYQFRIILQAKIMRNKGYPQSQVQSAIKAHPYVVKLAFDRSAKFTEKQLVQMLDIFTETDANIKRGKMDKNIAFELLLYQLITA